MKKFILFLSILLIAAAVAIVIINIFILPTKAKAFIITSLEQKLGRKVEIAKLSYIPFSSLSLDDVTVYADPVGAQTLLNAENIKLNLSVLPFLIQKKILSTVDVTNLKIRDAKLKGTVRTSLTPDAAGSIGLSGTVRLVNVSLDTGFLDDDIERLNGVIDIEGDGVQINNAYFYFRGVNYRLNGGLKNLEEQRINLSISSNGKGLHSEGNFLLRDGYLEI